MPEEKFFADSATEVGLNPDKVQARYSNGCLSISIGKREASKPRAITIQ